MQDWDGAMLAEAEAKKDSMPRFHPIPAVPPISIREWSSSNLSHNVSHVLHLIVYVFMDLIISCNFMCIIKSCHMKSVTLLPSVT